MLDRPLARCTAALLFLFPVAATQAQLGPPPAVARALYQSPLEGPQRRTMVEADYAAQLPDANSGCSLVVALWTYPLCRPGNQLASDRGVSSTGASVSARVGYPMYARQPQLCTTVNGAFSTCSTSAGARAAADYGTIRAHAEARGAFTLEAELPDLTTPDPSDSQHLTFGLTSTATATGEWSTELTPSFTGYLAMAIGIEMHERTDGAGSLADPLGLGSGTLTFGLFRKPPGLVAPPLCPGGPSANGCGQGWQFYGSNWSEEQNNAEFWGWEYVDGASEDWSTLGSGLITFGFDVEAGAEYALVMRLSAFATDNQYADFWGTARLDHFEVPDGESLSFAAGVFDVRQRGGGGASPVPEPSVLALLLLGGVGVLARRVRRYP